MVKMKGHYSLFIGRENVMPVKALAETLGFSSDRDLLKQIERNGPTGAVILSVYHCGGYYLSNAPEALQRFTRTLNASAKNTAKATQSVHEALDAATGQEKLKGWWR